MPNDENEEKSEPSAKPEAGHSPSDMVSEEEIDYNVMGSFPASDPPAWTLGIRPNKTFHTEFDGNAPGPEEPSHQNEPAE